MISFSRKNAICVVLFAFVLSLIGNVLYAASKHEIYQLSQRIKQKQTQIDNLYAELRKLNEEGGPESQEKAQIVMAQICELKKELAELHKNMQKLKKDAGLEEEFSHADSRPRR